VRLNTDASVETVAALQPESVVIATGSCPQRAEIMGGQQILTVHEVLEQGLADAAQHVVILDREGFNRPFVVADYLSARGVQVEFVTPLLQVGPLMEHWSIDEMVRVLQGRGVRFWPGHEVAEWDESGARLRDVQTGEERVLEGVDTLVGAVGSRPVNELAPQLRHAGLEVHVIGDANIPQTVEQATYQGARIGRLL
jgi:2,4-dienoyl-CoA reductase (NADPH2)